MLSKNRNLTNRNLEIVVENRNLKNRNLKVIVENRNWKNRNLNSIELRSIFFWKLTSKKNWKMKLWKLKIEKQKVEKRNAEFSLKFIFTFKNPILAAYNSRFVSWLVQFLSEFLSLNQYFVYFWNVKCRKYATRQSGKTL